MIKGPRWRGEGLVSAEASLMAHDLRTELAAFCGQQGIRFAPDAPLAPLTSLRIGGPAYLVAWPEEESQVAALYRRLRQGGVPLLILGRGTNVLLPDEGLALVVISLAKLVRIQRRGTRVEASAGAPVSQISHLCGQWGLAGLEFGVGIPGTVGGGLYSNAGTHEGDMASVLEKARVMDEEGEVLDVGAEDLKLSYRRSLLQQRRWLVLSALFALREGDPEAIQGRMRAHLDFRRRTQPLEHPSVGSIFRNPPGDSAGRLVEAAGLKGLRVGGAEISAKHGNFIVNLGAATASDVLALIRTARRRVREATGIDLELEVRVLDSKGRVRLPKEVG